MLALKYDKLIVKDLQSNTSQLKKLLIIKCPKKQKDYSSYIKGC